jgi:nucleolar protein 14
VFFGGGGFTHKGKPLAEDDFDEQISASSDDESPDKGKLTEEMVNTMNFGQGDGQTSDERKKSRKEIFEEIIEKSKAYKEANKELKNINTELIKELDDDYLDIIGKLDFTRRKNGAPAESEDPRIKQADDKGKEFD